MVVPIFLAPLNIEHDLEVSKPRSLKVARDGPTVQLALQLRNDDAVDDEIRSWFECYTVMIQPQPRPTDGRSGRSSVRRSKVAMGNRNPRHFSD